MNCPIIFSSIHLYTGSHREHIRFRSSVVRQYSAVMLGSREGHVHLVHSEEPNLHSHYVCEFEPVVAVTTESPKVKLADISNSTFQFPAVRCPSGHYTHQFLACDTHSDCWALDDVRMDISMETGYASTSRWCDLSQNVPEELYFLCRRFGEHVPFTLVCDHGQDCFDGSDEDFCYFRPCFLQKYLSCSDGGEVSVTPFLCPSHPSPLLLSLCL